MLLIIKSLQTSFLRKCNTRECGELSHKYVELSAPHPHQTIEEISKIVEQQYKRAIALLRKNKKKLTELAEYLLDKEVIFKDDLVTIFGKRPFEKEDPVAKLTETSTTKKTEKST